MCSSLTVLAADALDTVNSPHGPACTHASFNILIFQAIGGGVIVCVILLTHFGPFGTN